MPLWTCDFENCQRPAVRTLGDCVLCNRHLCSIHVQSEHHTCPPEDTETHYHLAGDAEKSELNELIGEISISALEARASHIRGVSCSISLPKHARATQMSIMGGMNYHIEISFEDGIQWIARIRRVNATSPPAMLRDYIIQSEVATLMFLEKIQVPAPKVYDFALESPENPVGVGFILMEKLPDTSLQWCDANLEQRTKVMEKIADILIELHKYPFDPLGSLHNPGETQIGLFAQELLSNIVKLEIITTGPYTTSEQYHMSSLQHILDLIVQEEIYSDKAVEAYLIDRYLMDLVPLVLPAAQADEKFYLHHADDKGDHILVDENHNITGIIDWEWAHTAPSSHAFNSPIGFLPVKQFCDGINSLGDDETIFARLLEKKGRADLAKFVWSGRLQHRFLLCRGYRLDDWDGFLGLFRALRAAVAVDEGMEWDEWKHVALQRYKDDAGLREVLARQ